MSWISSAQSQTSCRASAKESRPGQKDEGSPTFVTCGSALVYTKNSLWGCPIELHSKYLPCSGRAAYLSEELSQATWAAAGTKRLPCCDRAMGLFAEGSPKALELNLDLVALKQEPFSNRLRGPRWLQSSNLLFYYSKSANIWDVKLR